MGLVIGHPWQSREHIPKVGVWIDSATTATFDDGVDDGAAFSGLGLSDEEPILFSDGRWSDRVFDQVVVHFDAPIGEVMF